MYQMLNLVNTASMEEIALYIEVVRVKTQVNQSVGAYTDLLVKRMIMSQNLTMVVGLVAIQYRILTNVEYMEIMNIVKMTRLTNMLIMNLMEV